MKKTILFTVFSLFLTVLISTNSYAASYDYGFVKIASTNGAIDISDQLYVSVEEGSGGALFTFHNIVGTQSMITQLVFGDDNGVFSSIAHVENSGSDVAFNKDIGSGGYGFTTTFDRASEPNSGLDHADDWVSFFGTYSAGYDFVSLSQSILANTFHLGLHVQRIPLANGDNGDASDKYILAGGPIPGGFGGPDPVPLPAALWLFAPALLGFMGFRRKTKS